jgi:tyrosine-specific transport protein
VYLFLLYTLISAYISGGTDLISSILQLLHINTPSWCNALLFVLVLGAVTARGIGFVDNTNKILMFFKFGLYFILLFSVVPYLNWGNYSGGEPAAVVYALPILITAFGFSVIIPSLRSYLEDDLKKLKITIIVGSLLPLIVYILWVAAILGTVPRAGDRGLMAILGTPHEVSYLALRLQQSLNDTWIGDLFRAFSTVSILTSFLAVSLSLTDFLADGFSQPKKGWRGLAILVLTFLPPLTVVWLNPSLFILGLRYAGLCVVILFGLMPALMVWVFRYIRRQPGYQVFGGRPALVLSVVASFAIIFFGVKQLMG